MAINESLDTILFWTGTGFALTVLSGMASWAVSIGIRFFIRIMYRGS
jgi:hypothetical protein